MMEQFDLLIDRHGTNAYKWDHAGGKDVIAMWVADMDFRTAPCVIEALRRRVEHGVFGYVSVPESYYDSVINWFGLKHHWHIEREWILYTSGVVPAISAVIKALVRPEEKVLVMTPVYNCFFSSIRNNGCVTSESPLVYADGTYKIDYDDLERRASDPATKVLLMCNPHNPAGRVWSATELEQVGQICRKHHVIIISDEIHCELVMPGNQFTPMASVSPEMQDGVITCNSPSKSFNTAGLQIANIITNNARWREAIDHAINVNEVCDVNPFGVEAVQAAYSAEGEQWLGELNQYLWGNYETLTHFFAKKLTHLPVTRLEGTYLVWVDISALGVSSDEITRRLLESARVAVNAGTMYGAAGEGFIRLNIAMPRARMIEALQRMVPVLSL